MTAPIIPGAEPVSIAGGPAGAILLLHGYMGTVQTVRDWAMAFAQAGFTVEAPLLPGHGTSPEDMLETNWSDYLNYADECYQKLAQRYERVFVGGLCLGGPLAASIVTRHPETAAGLIIINGNFQLPTRWNADFLREMLRDNRQYFRWFRGQTVEDPHAPPLIVYEMAPIAPMMTIRGSLGELYKKLNVIRCPILVFTSRLDSVLEPGEDEPSWTKEVSGSVEHVWLERSRHLATMDYDKDILEARSVEFALAIARDLQEHVSPNVA